MYLVPLGELNLKPELLRLLDKKKNQQPNNLQSYSKEEKNETPAPKYGCFLCVIVHEVLTTFKEEKKNPKTWEGDAQKITK